MEKDYNEAYGYMRNAEKKSVKDAANLASQLINDLGLDRFEATHTDKVDKKGNRKTKPLAISNISPVGGDVSIHLPLEEGRELYLTIGVEPRAAKGVDGFGGSDLEVTHIMFRVDHSEGTGNDRYGRNVFVDSKVTYSDLLKQVQREAYKYLPGKAEAKEGEYYSGDKVEYSPDGGRTWHDAVVAQPNDEEASVLILVLLLPCGLMLIRISCAIRQKRAKTRTSSRKRSALQVRVVINEPRAMLKS